MIEKLIIVYILLQVHLTYAQNESPPSTCNSCCQGQTGREGNPGIPGIPGHPGNVGPKGDRGESLKGERGHGQKGDSGIQGSKGDQGLGGLRGSPGKTGPMGVPGSVGSPGSPGVKGQKGEIGQGQGNSISAFSAVRTTSFTPSSAGIPLPFQKFHTNVGDDFDLASGRFTCEIPGIYLFTYSIRTAGRSPHVALMKNDATINSVYQGGSDDTISNQAVLQLNSGDELWLRCVYSGRLIHGDTSFFTSFSGILLYKL